MDTDALPVFPRISRAYIEQCQFSAWYPIFKRVSPRATVIRPLSAEFRAYLEEDGVVVPDGSEDFPASSSLSDAEDSDDAPQKTYAFPELDKQIRDAIARYGAVFPKLNWTSPKDASWILPTLKCTSPVDVYLLLKSSDFVSHDLDASLAFESCTDEELDGAPAGHSRLHDLELVLKKWYAVDHGREFRCFVRDETLLGISQRDPNYYPHLNENSTQAKILSTVLEFWKTRMEDKFKGGGHYVFDVHLTRDLSSAHLFDINPYHSKTDSLLFTYDELLRLLIASSPDLSDAERTTMPALRVIESPSDPAATRNSPANQHNAVPFDALQMSTGQDIDAFADRWKKELTRTLDDEADSDDED